MRSYLFSIVLFFISLAIFFSYSFFTRKKMCFFHTAELYNGFQMKKELERELDKIQSARNLLLDSLKTDAEQAAVAARQNAALQNDFLRKRNLFIEKEKQFAEDNNATARRYTEQIWTQLNQYVKDYGNKNGYTYILGADGSGTLMYAEEDENITGPLLIFVNERYKGVNTGKK